MKTTPFSAGVLLLSCTVAACNGEDAEYIEPLTPVPLASSSARSSTRDEPTASCTTILEDWAGSAGPTYRHATVDVDTGKVYPGAAIPDLASTDLATIDGGDWFWPDDATSSVVHVDRSATREAMTLNLEGFDDVILGLSETTKGRLAISTPGNDIGGPAIRLFDAVTGKERARIALPATHRLLGLACRAGRTKKPRS